MDRLGGLCISNAHVLIRLVPSFVAALQAYQVRAAQCGHSFAHMVLLEAAVQGWYVPALPFYCVFPACLKHA